MEETTFNASIGLTIGVLMFLLGFSILKRKRLIQNVPTAKLRSMAIGLVEVEGQALDWCALKAPFSKKRCVYYEYKIDEERGSRRHRYWKNICKGDSVSAPFYIKDDSGVGLVYPKSAEFDLQEDFYLKTYKNESIPDHIMQFLSVRSIKFRSLLGFNKTLRFCETCIVPGDKLYVLGFCQDNRKNLAEQHKLQLVSIREKIKADPELYRQFDTDGDGTIDKGEWELAYLAMEDSLQEAPQIASPLFIGAGPGRSSLFFISENCQKEIVDSLIAQLYFFIYGGLALSLVSLWYLL